MAEKLNDLLKLNLQFFAEDSGSEGATSETENQEGENQEGNSEGSETLELTAEELQKRIESESDKKLNKVLEKKMKEWKAEYDQKLEEARKEGERLAKLSAKERQEEEVRKKAELLEKREKELLKKELKAQTIEDLHSKNLPPQFAGFLMGEDAESTLENINAFKSDYDKAIEKAVEERLKGKSPTTGTGSTGKQSTETSQQKFMDIFEKNRIVGK